jgi:ABC-type transport system involved in Fe-S cluster assembly fused permease/ATPase subunit
MKLYKKIFRVSHCGKQEIVVLDKGRVIEEGAHRELYNRGGKYYKLWQKQSPAFLN